MKLTKIFCGVLLCGVFDGAFAQSSVTLYGLVDNGIEYQNAGNGGTVRAVSGGFLGSRYGLKGSEDIGGGLHINFQLEQGFSGVTGTAIDPTAAFNRQAWVGASGSFGEVRLGRQNTPQYLYLNGEFDPTGVNTIASPLNNFDSLTARISNAISYFTPVAYGLSAQFMVAMRDTTTKPNNGLQFYNAVVMYTHGPFRGGAGYEQAANAGGTSLLRILNVGGSVAVGAAKFYLAYHTERQTDNSDKRDVYGASASYSFSPADQLSLMYGYAHDRTGAGNSGQQLGVMYEYFLSKLTTLYGSAGFIQNRNEARFSLNGSGYAGIPVAPGANARGIMFAMQRKF